MQNGSWGSLLDWQKATINKLLELDRNLGEIELALGVRIGNCQLADCNGANGIENAHLIISSLDAIGSRVNAIHGAVVGRIDNAHCSAQEQAQAANVQAAAREAVREAVQLCERVVNDAVSHLTAGVEMAVGQIVDRFKAKKQPKAKREGSPKKRAA